MSAFLLQSSALPAELSRVLVLVQKTEPIKVRFPKKIKNYNEVVNIFFSICFVVVQTPTMVGGGPIPGGTAIPGRPVAKVQQAGDSGPWSQKSG